MCDVDDDGVGFDGDIKIAMLKKKESGKNTVFSFDMKLTPGKGGGAGVTIPAPASNHYFNLAGTDSKAVQGMSKAFSEAAKKSTKDIGNSLHRWFARKGNWLWRIVGWEDRENWKKPEVKVVSIKLGRTMIDPTRRKWPSGRTEIYIPLTVRVQATAQRKG